MNERIYNEYKLYWPALEEKTLKWYITDDGMLIASLSDGDTIMYDEYDNAIRRLPKNTRTMSEEDCNKEFGRRLRRMLYRECITQKELSEMTGISLPTIGKYSRGEINPSFYNVRKIAIALKCSIDSLQYLEKE